MKDAPIPSAFAWAKYGKAAKDTTPYCLVERQPQPDDNAEAFYKVFVSSKYCNVFKPLAMAGVPTLVPESELELTAIAFVLTPNPSGNVKATFESQAALFEFDDSGSDMDSEVWWSKTHKASTFLNKVKKAQRTT